MNQGPALRKPLPPARVRLVPIALAGLALWIIGLVVITLSDFGNMARDVALVGCGLGILGLPIAQWFDRRSTARQSSDGR